MEESQVKITCLIDDLNTVENRFYTSFGFAVLIEKDGKNILFDTGTRVDHLVRNLNKCGVSPSAIDAIILSHNHYDHTNGLPGILKENPNVPIYVHREWNSSTAHRGDKIPKVNQVIIQEARELKEIATGLFITNCYQSSDYGGIFEHGCFVEAQDSYVLVCGCCHPGLNLFLQDRGELNIPSNALLCILGGLHSFKFDDKTAERLYPYIKTIYLHHCTMNARTFRAQFKEKCKIGVVGKTLYF